MRLLKNNKQINIGNSKILLKILQCNVILIQKQLKQNGQHAEMYAFLRSILNWKI